MTRSDQTLTPSAPTPSGPDLTRRVPDALVGVAVQDAIAVLSLAGRDGNRFDDALIAALTESLGRVLADRAVTGVVLATRGRDFCAGPVDDLRPPGPDAAPLPPALAALAALCRRIEAAPKPVICALHGRVASGGLAVALACRARVGDPRAVLCFPEARIGRLAPGNAGVRLAWQAGAAVALTLAAGNTVQAPAAADSGLIDHLTEDPLQGALALARDSSAIGALQTPGLRDAAGFRAAIVAARAALPVPLPAHRTIEAWRIDAIEAAQVLPADQALAFDLVRAQDAAQRPESRARAHLARASRRALAFPPSPDGTVAVSLAPGTAARLLPGLLHSGARVIVLAPDQDAVAQTLEAVAQAQQLMVRDGTVLQAASTADWYRITGQTALGASDSPAVALADSTGAAWLATILPPQTPLVHWSPVGTPLPELDEAPLVLVPAPTRPARLVEVITAEGMPSRRIDSVSALALRLGLTPLRASGGPLLTPLIRAAARAAACLRAAGVAPQVLADINILPAGLATGNPGPVAHPLPLSPERLVLLAVVNTAAWLLESGRAMRPSDLDLAMVLGAGWPEWRGGPMAEADSIGPMVLRHELRLAAALDPDTWTPEPIFDELIRRGWRFEDLNGE